MSDQCRSTPSDILLVEDNPGDVRLAKEAFETSGSEATLHTVTSGDEALALLSERRQSESLPYPDLLLLDLNLPRVDGFRVLEELRSDSEHRLLPVLILTSSEDYEDITKSYELAANAYLTKPSNPDGFVSLVRSVEEFWFNYAHLPPIST